MYLAMIMLIIISIKCFFKWKNIIGFCEFMIVDSQVFLSFILFIIMFAPYWLFSLTKSSFYFYTRYVRQTNVGLFALFQPSWDVNSAFCLCWLSFKLVFWRSMSNFPFLLAFCYILRFISVLFWSTTESWFEHETFILIKKQSQQEKKMQQKRI